MPFTETKDAYIYDPKGKLRLPPGPPAWGITVKQFLDAFPKPPPENKKKVKNAPKPK